MAGSDRLIAAWWGAVSLALLALSPLRAEIARLPLACPVRSWIGVACPSCGALRSAVGLAGLDPLGALAINPLATLGWIGLVGGGLFAGGSALANRPLPRLPRRPSRGVRAAIVAAFLANWVYLLATGT